ncbi:UDP-N-acetylmuramoyl-L-alanine--D-glutamate ligase [Candidatus Acetothermia bacterium]|nr:UDP-N-acetylmuramoyl-L-alanine--D-glutamate ligase [Candidatus Acetothermia bacterium]MCI2432602.1 UDP-N-acetylmuramoyl-L-alanine--D-glutamate ligase [Candidatus Acetothermia bacterium]
MRTHIQVGSRVAVLGAGRSGLAAAQLLRKIGADVFVSDGAPLSETARATLHDLNIPFEEGGHTHRALDSTDLVVLSPGISLYASMVQEARARQIPIWGELELAYRFCPSSKIIAVTGTNGKSTTTLLIERLLKRASLDVVSAGNLGVPLSERLHEITPETIVVLETSSFQLESIQKFRPHVAVFLNISPNHLDRHGSFAEYLKTKCRIFENQTEKDFLILPRALELPQRPRSRRIFYDEVLTPPFGHLNLSPSPSPKAGGEPLPFREGVGVRSGRGVPPGGVRAREPADHWRLNAAAAWAAARLFAPQIPLPQFEDLPKLPHRQEFIAEIAGVKFYDDSKATTVHATLAALAAIPGPLVLILGGRAKGQDFAQLAEALSCYEICEICLIGESAPQIAQALERANFRRFFIESFDEAVERALRYPNASCLLSPACASFDQFSNYEERGEVFRQAVLRRQARELSESHSVTV